MNTDLDTAVSYKVNVLGCRLYLVRVHLAGKLPQMCIKLKSPLHYSNETRSRSCTEAQNLLCSWH